MTPTFKFEKRESTASSLYEVKAVDSDGTVMMTWHIACDDESSLQELAEQAYAEAIRPKIY